MKGQSPSHLKIIPVKKLITSQSFRLQKQQPNKNAIKFDETNFSFQKQSPSTYSEDQRTKTKQHQKYHQQHILIKTDKRQRASSEVSRTLTQTQTKFYSKSNVKWDYNDCCNPVREKNKLLQMYKNNEIFRTPTNKQQNIKDNLIFDQSSSISMLIPNDEIASFNSKNTNKYSGHGTADETSINSNILSEKGQQQKSISRIRQKVSLYERQVYLSGLQKKLQQRQRIILKQKKNIEDLQNKFDNQIKKHLKKRQDQETNIKILHLRIRSLQCDDKNKMLEIQQLKKKIEKIRQNNQKIIKAQKQIIRQKEEEIKNIYSQLINHKIKDKMFKYEQERINQSLLLKQFSQEMSDMKIRVMELEQRIKEMIENQDQLKKVQTNQDRIIFQERLEFEEKIKFKQQQRQLLNQIVEDYKRKYAGKETELQIIQKTSQQYMLKIDKYERCCENMRQEIKRLRNRNINKVDSGVDEQPTTENRSLKLNDNKEKEEYILRYEKIKKELQKLCKRNQEIITKLQNTTLLNKELNEKIIQLQLQKLNQQFTANQGSLIF